MKTKQEVAKMAKELREAMAARDWYAKPCKQTSHIGKPSIRVADYELNDEQIALAKVYADMFGGHFVDFSRNVTCVIPKWYKGPVADDHTYRVYEYRIIFFD